VLKRSGWLAVIAVVALAAVGYWWWSSRGAPAGTVDLVEAFRAAEKRSSVDINAAFAMDPQTVKGETKPAIYIHPTSRVIYRDIQIPPHAQLQAFLALKEEVWDKGTDGVYFRIGVTANDVYEDLLKRHVDPYRVAGDRGWIPVTIDLSRYAGQKVQVIFNTNSSLPGHGDHSMYDYAIIGAPRIVSAPPRS
jgi:hypothetical protein